MSHITCKSDIKLTEDGLDVIAGCLGMSFFTGTLVIKSMAYTSSHAHADAHSLNEISTRVGEQRPENLMDFGLD